MKNVLARQPETASPTISPAQEYLSAVRLDDALPDWLTQDSEGRTFAPVQLGGVPGSTLPEQITQIMRVEPVGGAEPLVETNAERVLQRARDRLYQRLSLSQSGGQTRAFLCEVQALLRVANERMEARAQSAEQSYRSAQEYLRRWQERTNRRASGGFWNGFVSLVLGAGEQVSLPQAVVHWNAREQWHLSRTALHTAHTVLTQTLDTATYLLDHLDALTAQVTRLRDEAQQRLASTARAALVYEPLTLRLDTATIAARLTRNSIGDEVISAWLGRLSQQMHDAPDSIIRGVQAFAQHEAAQRLDALDILTLLELEASTLVDDDHDALLLIGQGLIDALARCPTPALVATAQPRSETLQITPDGQPLYSLDGMHTAAYGAPGDRMGFVQVHMGLALQDLRLMRDGAASFEEALQQRNFYALEELAEAWEQRTLLSEQGRSTPMPVQVVFDGTAAPSLATTKVINDVNGM